MRVAAGLWLASGPESGPEFGETKCRFRPAPRRELLTGFVCHRMEAALNTDREIGDPRMTRWGKWRRRQARIARPLFQPSWESDSTPKASVDRADSLCGMKYCEKNPRNRDPVLKPAAAANPVAKGPSPPAFTVYPTRCSTSSFAGCDARIRRATKAARPCQHGPESHS